VETDPGARRQGYGRLLLLHATEHLRSLGAHDVTCCHLSGQRGLQEAPRVVRVRGDGRGPGRFLGRARRARRALSPRDGRRR
jgi:GNAT superfamily N-acetyltransferase